MACEFKNGYTDDGVDCDLAEACTYPECEDAIPLNPVSFPLGPPTIEGTDIKKDVGLK
jgi:hypothetical protein